MTPKSDKNKREKAFEREYIAIPGAALGHEDDLSEYDEALLDDFGDSINFLAVLDQQGIARYFAPSPEPRPAPIIIYSGVKRRLNVFTNSINSSANPEPTISLPLIPMMRTRNRGVLTLKILT